MGFRCGIVGLPNVGKSTLFNSLTSTAKAAAENYPFCTIEPNVARVPVPDERLSALAAVVHSTRVIAARMEFVDIAGLVRGAGSGEGLGNKFLGHIRETDAIIHVTRCYENSDITHVDGSIDPLRDIETIDTELLLADLEVMERRLTTAQRSARGGDSEAKMELALIECILEALRAGRAARGLALTPSETGLLKTFHLLTAKPVLFVCNVDEESASGGNAYSQSVIDHAEDVGAGVLIVAAEIEAQLALMDAAEGRRDYLNMLGLKSPGLERVIEAGYRLLGLITFLTAGEKEVRAWTVNRGASAIEAAAVIHTDFAKGFIRAEVYPYDAFVALGGEQGVKEAGKMRLEGRDYIVHDGDVLHFRFNV